MLAEEHHEDDIDGIIYIDREGGMERDQAKVCVCGNQDV